MQRQRERAGRLAVLVGWFVLLVVGIALFTGWTDPRLATPALLDPTAWGAWLEARDPTIAAIAVVRLVLIALTWYLLGATTIQVVAQLGDNLRLARLANALSIPVVRRVVRVGLGVGLAASMVTSATNPHEPVAATADVTSAVAADDGAPREPTPPGPATRNTATAPTMIRGGVAHDPAAGDATTTRHRSAAPSGAAQTGGTIDGTATAGDPPTLHVGGATTGDGAQPTNHPPTMRTGATDPAGGRAPADDAVDGDDTWTVRSGDHLWNIAERVLADHLGHAPTDAQVAPYWRRVVEANRQHLPDPGNPDLVLPGMTVELPDPAIRGNA